MRMILKLLAMQWKGRSDMPILADIIIIAILVAIVFFILRSQIRKFRQGQCGGGCPGCGGSCGGCMNMPMDKAKK